jgi:hypothetical protein
LQKIKNRLEGRICTFDNFSSPLFLLAYSVFAEDEKMQEKIDLYFQKLQEMPWWIVGLWVSVVAAIYGLKATDVININKNK